MSTVCIAHQQVLRTAFFKCLQRFIGGTREALQCLPDVWCNYLYIEQKLLCVAEQVSERSVQELTDADATSVQREASFQSCYLSSLMFQRNVINGVVAMQLSIKLHMSFAPPLKGYLSFMDALEEQVQTDMKIERFVLAQREASILQELKFDVLLDAQSSFQFCFEQVWKERCESSACLLCTKEKVAEKCLSIFAHETASFLSMVACKDHDNAMMQAVFECCNTAISVSDDVEEEDIEILTAKVLQKVSQNTSQMCHKKRKLR